MPTSGESVEGGLADDVANITTTLKLDATTLYYDGSGAAMYMVVSWLSDPDGSAAHGLPNHVL